MMTTFFPHNIVNIVDSILPYVLMMKSIESMYLVIFNMTYTMYDAL